jgi:hypothetical protein
MRRKKTLIIIVTVVLIMVFIIGYIIYRNQQSMDYKPNIYIYPTKKTHLVVDIKFPDGGRIEQSIPTYMDNWAVDVEKSGLINGKYEYLYYESSQPDKWQEKTGWVVSKDSLSIFFKQNMLTYGFNNKEIKDFIDFWVPRLNKHKYFLIYPQELENINKLIQLNFSEKPDNLLRLHYLIKGANNKSSLPTHIISTKFSRQGFCVTEWGVILK